MYLHAICYEIEGFEAVGRWCARVCEQSILDLLDCCLFLSGVYPVTASMVWNICCVEGHLARCIEFSRCFPHSLHLVVAAAANLLRVPSLL